MWGNQDNQQKEPLTQEYIIHGAKLQTEREAKYLELTISSDLSWNSHVDITAKKATQSKRIKFANLGQFLSHNYFCSEFHFYVIFYLLVLVK